MSDEWPTDIEYEPEDLDPDAPISVLPEGGGDPPVETDPADWLDQHRLVSDEADDDER